MTFSAWVEAELFFYSTFFLMRRIFLVGLTAVAAFGTLQAQTARRSHHSVAQAPVDSTALIAQAYALQLDSLSKAVQTAVRDSDDVLENPYYFPLFAGNTLYDAQLARCRTRCRRLCSTPMLNVLIW